MIKRDNYIKETFFSINRKFLQKIRVPRDTMKCFKKISSHGIGWDLKKKVYVPRDGMGYLKKISSHGTAGYSKFAVPSHPMGRFLQKSVPWNGMGWDYPIPRGALVLKFIRNLTVSDYKCNTTEHISQLKRQIFLLKKSYKIKWIYNKQRNT